MSGLGLGLAPANEGRWTQFDPKTIAGMTLFLDYQNGFTPAQWSDQSGAGNHYMQATPANQGANSAAGVVFDGASTFYSGPVVNTLVSLANCTIFWAGQIDAISTDNAATYLNVAILGDRTGLAFSASNLRSGTPGAYMYCFDGGVKSAGPAAIALGSQVILTGRQFPSSLGVQKNGNAEVTAASGSHISDTAITDLGRGDAAFFFQGKMKFLLIYNTALTASQIANVQRYLALRSGLAPWS